MVTTEKQAAEVASSLLALPQPAHTIPYADVLDALSVPADAGLTTAEASHRLTQHGANELEQGAGVQPVRIFFEQVFNAMTLVLLLALAASFGIQAWIEGGILGGIIVFNIFLGFFQTLKAEKTIESLKTLGNPNATLLRDGRAITVSTAEIVPGDIVHLDTGDSVPADIRLLTAVNLKADETMLTGESLPASKNANTTSKPDTGPGDRLNMVFSSTTIVEGRGSGVAVATGMDTEIGQIASALNGSGSDEREVRRTWYMRVASPVGKFLGLTVGTPLQKKLSELFLWLFGIAIICAIVVLGANKFDSRRDVIIYAITTAVGTIPVSLLLVLTVTMAAGTKKMLERNVMVRNLSSLEALGGVTDVCSDKTGTITQGRMIVRQAWLPGVGTYQVEAGNEVYNPTSGSVRFSKTRPQDLDVSGGEYEIDTIRPGLEPYLNVASLANLATVERRSDSEKTEEWVARGAPTEVAIEVFAGRFGWSRPRLTQGHEAAWDVVAEFAFDSDVKRMSVIAKHLPTKEHQVFTKGAVERVLGICSAVATPGTESKDMQLDSPMRSEILENMEVMASQGLRVLAFASKSYDGILPDPDIEDEDGEDVPRDTVESDLTFLGLIGIYDPPRPESKPSVLACQTAGITVHMLTGDHVATARAIAAEVSILPADLRMLPADVLKTLVMPATDFDALTDAQLDALPQLPLVVARCAPSTKVRMIDALHRRGRYCAMTGDGINDAPSLKRSDIGIAMGSGSDVAKESSDIVLTDDNFASILNAIEEGRRIFDNIQKFILHVLAANLGFVVALLAGLAFKDATGISVFQLSPVEIIWMLVGTGAFCETGLGFERAVPDILNRPPQNLKYGVFTPEFFADMLVYGFLEAACIMGTFTVVVYGFNDGDLGLGCNNDYSEACQPVFRARATSYTTTTWVFLLFAWQLIDTRRSFFDFEQGVKHWARHLWGNKFLFFSVTVVFVMVVPTLYIPKLNHIVFLHDGISWEWAVVFVAVIGYMVGAEAWKWAKRVYFRRKHSSEDAAAV
ncbi:P-type Na(+) transporter [Ascochyta lentis]